MKIAMFTNSFSPRVGGVSLSVQRFVHGYRERGHHVIVVAPEWKGRPGGEKGVLRVPAVQNVTDMEIAFPLPFESVVERVIDPAPPDIIHAHQPHMLGTMALRLAAEHLTPLVFTYHTRYEFYAHYVSSGSPAFQRFAAELGAGYCRLADQVIAPSESIRQLLLDRGVETPVEAIPTGVDLDEYADGDGAAARERVDIPADAFLCGIVSRLTPEKNVEFLARAVARYLSREENAWFLVVGYGTALETMRDIVAEEGVEDRCRFAGKTTGQKLVDAYHALDAFVFASKTETQGMVLVEALAAGCPLVALDAPGAREVVDDCVNGRLIAEEDEGAFADGLKWVAERATEDPELLRERARQSAQPFCTHRCVERVLSLYAEVIERGPGKFTGRQGGWSAVMRELQQDWAIWGNRLSALLEAIRAADEADLDEE